MGTNNNSEETIDGFSDSKAQGKGNSPDGADYGTEGRKQPMSEEERMKAEREIAEKGDQNRLQERKQD